VAHAEQVQRDGVEVVGVGGVLIHLEADRLVRQQLGTWSSRSNGTTRSPVCVDLRCMSFE